MPKLRGVYRFDSESDEDIEYKLKCVIERKLERQYMERQLMDTKPHEPRRGIHVRFRIEIPKDNSNTIEICAMLIQSLVIFF